LLAAPDVPPAPSARPSLDPVLGSVPTDEGAPSAEIVVHRGDCLWSVVARAMGPGASDADVAHAWPRWFERNRAVIGADPGLLLPGQRLVPPTAR
jgi:hypothetical protein